MRDVTSGKKYLCLVLHEGPGGRRFAEEFKRRFHQRFGSNVLVVTDIESFAQDKYDALISYLNATQYCIVALNREFMADSWRQYCSRQVKYYSVEKELVLIPVGVDGCSEFTGMWNLYSPMVFGCYPEREEYKYGVLLNAIKYTPCGNSVVSDCKAGGPTGEERTTDEDTRPSTPPPESPAIHTATFIAPFALAEPSSTIQPRPSDPSPQEPLVRQDSLPADFNQFRNDQTLDLFAALD